MVAALVLSFSGTDKAGAMTDAEVMARARELGMTDGNEVLSEAYTVVDAPELETEEMIETVPSTEAASEVLTEAETEASLEASTEAVSEASTEGATEAATETSTEASSEASSKTGSEASAEAATEASTEASSEAAEEAVTEDTSEVSSEAKNITSELTGEDKTKSELLADAAETEAESISPVTDSASGFISVHISGGSSYAVAKALENAGAVADAAAFDRYLCTKGYDRRLSTGDFRIPAGAGEEEIALILMRR